LTGREESQAAGQSASLLRRAAELSEAVDLLENREAAADALEGLEQAFESFDSLLQEIQSFHRRARALVDTGRPVELPDGRPTARSLRALADRVDADPDAARNRRRQLDAVSTYASSIKSTVEPALKQIVDESRGGIEAGTVSSLRKIGLREAADALDAELNVLRRYIAELPQTKEDLDAVDAAAMKIRQVSADLAEPRKAKLLKFVQDVSAGGVTLADIDRELLAEIQESGVAADFAIGARR